MSLNFDPNFPGQYGSFPSGGLVTYDNAGIYLDATSHNTADIYVISDVVLEEIFLIFNGTSVKTLDGFTLGVPNGDPLQSATISGPPTSSPNPHYIHIQHSPGFGNWGGANPVWQKIGEVQFTLEPGITELALDDNPSSGTRAVSLSQANIVLMTFANMANPSNHSFEVSWSVPPPGPTAVISQPTTGLTINQGETVFFEGQNSLLPDGTLYINASPASLTFSWLFADGQTSSDPNPSITFPAGTWSGDTVLTVTDDQTGTQDVARLVGQTYQVNTFTPDYSLQATAQVAANGDLEWQIDPGLAIDKVNVGVEINGNNYTFTVTPSSPGAVSTLTVDPANLSHQHGTYNWTATGEDSGGNAVGTPVTGALTVAQPDTNPPVITVTHHASSWFHIAGNNWSEPGVSAYDNEEGASVAVTTTNAPTTNTGVTQSMSVGYSASDSSGNSSSATRVISVLDFPTIDTDWDGLLTITSASPGVGNTPTQYDIVIQDSNGTVVASSASPLGVGVGSLDVSSLAPGTYQINVQLSLLASHPQHQAVSWTGYDTKLDLSVQVTNLTIDDTTLPADGSATFVFGADVYGYSFDVVDDNSHSSVWSAGVGVTNPTSPTTVTTTGTIPAGDYTWTLTGIGPSGETNSTTGTFSVAADLSLTVTNCSVDASDIPSVTIAWGTNVASYNFSLTSDADGTEYFGVLNNDTTGDTSPHTSTGSNNLPPGNYSWAITGAGDAGQNITGNSGSLSITVPLGFHSVAVTSDARPWDMANVRWGLPAGLTLANDVFVQVERKEGLNGAWGVLSSNQAPDGGGLNGSSGTGYHDQGLTPSTTYYYRLIFVDSNGTLGAYSTELEYATIAIPTLATVDVDTRGVKHPVVAITGSGIVDWYWTTETVANPQDRTKAEWDSDANAHHVSNGSGGVTSAIMSHLGPGAGNPAGNHLPGTYSVTVCGFWGGGSPLTADMNDPSITANTVHVIPYNVYSGLIGVVATDANLGSDWVYRFDVTKPNDSYDWHRIRHANVAASPAFGAGVSAAAWGTEAPLGSSGEAQVAETMSISDPENFVIHLVPTSNENDEQAPNSSYVITGFVPKGCASVTATVSGNNLAGTDNVTFVVSPAGARFSPTGIIRVGDTPPPVSGGLSNWGSIANVASSSVTVNSHIKTPGTHTFYAQAVFPDGTPIGNVVSTTYTIAQAPYTGLTELKFTQEGPSVTLEAHGYFPQWRYYVGELPYRTEVGSDMSADPNGTAITEDIQTPTTEPSKVLAFPIEPNKRVVVIGLATDGQYLIGKPLIRVLYYSTRTAEDEYKLRGQTAERWDPNDIAVAGVWSKELDDNGNKKKEVLTTSLASLKTSLNGWEYNGLTEADLGNLFIRPNGVRRPLEKMAAYVAPVKAAGGFTVTGQDADGNDVYGSQTEYTYWSSLDGSDHMGIDFSAEIAADFANVDNALVTLVTTVGNGVVNFETLTAATAGVNLTADPNGVLAWPLDFVKERLGEARQAGLVPREDWDQIHYGKRGKRTTSGEGDDKFTQHKRADIKDLYPSASLGENEWTKEAAIASGAAKVSNRALYADGFGPAKLRSGVAEKVPAADFVKKPPVFKVTSIARPDTSSARRAPGGAMTDIVIDQINDRPARGLLQPTPTVSASFTDPVALFAELQGHVPDLSNLAIGGSVIPANPADRYNLSFEAENMGGDPVKELFIDWSNRAEADVPMEVLSRYLTFGNAVTETQLQELYDLEKTGVTGTPGTGRNRTAWKTEIETYATLIGVTISL